MVIIIVDNSMVKCTLTYSYDKSNINHKLEFDHDSGCKNLRYVPTEGVAENNLYKKKLYEFIGEIERLEDNSEKK